MLTVYGIKQCDTCRKALKWLEGRVAHRFHDLRVDGLERGMVEEWLASDFSDALVNKRSTTWRQLTEAERDAAGDELVNLLLANPTLIKRPIFVEDDVVAVGFTPETQRKLTGDS